MQIASMTKFSGIIVTKKLPNAGLEIKKILRFFWRPAGEI